MNNVILGNQFLVMVADESRPALTLPARISHLSGVHGRVQKIGLRTPA